MEIRFHRTFLKHYEKLPAKIQARLQERLTTFSANPFDESLRNHSLTGEWTGCRSINVTVDYRAVYESVNENDALFLAVGTHSKLYR